ncbi:hypothetical protein BDW60DRAFT_179024 [Aspergillus nidulans var. acristatus]
MNLSPTIQPRSRRSTELSPGPSRYDVPSDIRSAGSETTALTLSGILYNIFRNRAVYEKLTFEIDAAIASHQLSPRTSRTPRLLDSPIWRPASKRGFECTRPLGFHSPATPHLPDARLVRVLDPREYTHRREPSSHPLRQVHFRGGCGCFPAGKVGRGRRECG